MCSVLINLLTSTGPPRLLPAAEEVEEEEEEEEENEVAAAEDEVTDDATEADEVVELRGVLNSSLSVMALPTLRDIPREATPVELSELARLRVRCC